MRHVSLPSFQAAVTARIEFTINRNEIALRLAGSVNAAQLCSHFGTNVHHCPWILPKREKADVSPALTDPRGAFFKRMQALKIPGRKGRRWKLPHAERGGQMFPKKSASTRLRLSFRLVRDCTPCHRLRRSRRMGLRGPIRTRFGSVSQAPDIAVPDRRRRPAGRHV